MLEVGGSLHFSNVPAEDFRLFSILYTCSFKNYQANQEQIP